MSLLAIGLAVLDVLLYTGQNFFNKMFTVHYDGPKQAATPVFCIFYGMICAIVTLVLSGFKFAPGPSTWAMGFIAGAAVFLFNYAGISAAQRGPYAFQSLCMLIGGIMPSMIFSALFWGDRFGLWKYVGVALMLAALVLFNCKGINFRGVKKGYFLFVLILNLSNGLYSIAVDAQARMNNNLQRPEMIVITFFTSAVLSLIYLFAAKCGSPKAAFHMNIRSLTFMLGSSACATAAIHMLLRILEYVPSTVLFTITNGGVMVTLALLCAIVLREKIEKHQWAAIAVALVSLCLLGLA